MSSPHPIRAAEPLREKAPPLAQLLNLPNLITLGRLLSIPIFVSMLTRHRFTAALWLFGAAALTDALDGTLARLTDSRTELGAFLDPFADKLLLMSSFVVLTIEQVFPGWLLVVVGLRDFVIVFGYFMVTFFTAERVPVNPSYLGKATTFLQLACVVAALMGFAANPQRYHWFGLLYLTVAVTAISGLQYIYRGLVILNSREPEMFSEQ
jgi:cardiolipin synthase